MSEARTLQIERTFDAPPARVFDAWTSEQVLLRWWQAQRGWETAEAHVDLRVGGAVRVVMRDPVEDVEHAGGGTYTEIEPPRRLAFTWTWDGDVHRTLIEIDFHEIDGGTKVSFRHRDLWDEKALRDHEQGWNALLDNLGHVLGPARRTE